MAQGTAVDLMSGYGGGRDADMLQEILPQRADEAFRNQQRQQEQQQIAGERA